MDELLTTTQLCQKLSTSRRNIEKLRSKGMPYMAFPMGSPRFCYPDVIEWLKSNAAEKERAKDKRAGLAE